MCAAPGSKTAQLIESLHADENQQPPSKFFCYIQKECSVKRVPQVILSHFSFQCHFQVSTVTVVLEYLTL